MLEAKPVGRRGYLETALCAHFSEGEDPDLRLGV